MTRWMSAPWHTRPGADRMAGLPARSCNDPDHEERRARELDDSRGGAPCLVCGAPIVAGIGHDEDCMAADPLCKYESTEPGTLLCILLDGHPGDHATPRYTGGLDIDQLQQDGAQR